MSKELVISATPHETRVAIVEDGLLCEIYIEREKEFALVGSLYKGRVTRVLPGMQSAFVDIGLDSDAFLYVSDFLEHLEDYDHVAAPVEPKIQKFEQQAAEVFAPSTTNGGVTHEPVPELAAEPAAPASPAITPLEGETIHAAAATSAGSESAPHPAPPAPHTQRPFEQKNDRGNDRGQDRGRGGFGDRGGRGGRNRRWGRQGGGGRDRGPRHDLPPSKYASPRPFEPKPHEAAPYEPPPVDPNYEPIILPGESLAKYKNRPLAGTPVVSPDASAIEASIAQPETPVESQAIGGESVREQFDAGLPDSLFAALPSIIYDEHPPLAAASPEPPAALMAAEEVVAVPQLAAPPVKAEPKSEAAIESEAALTIELHPQNGASLSEEEVNSLAEQLAEAKHEEAQAEAEHRSEPLDAAAEPFVEAAELDELQEALDTDAENESSEEEAEEDEAADDAAEADAIADEMHDVATAANAAPEHTGEHGELHEPESEDGHEEELEEEGHEQGHEEIHAAEQEGQHETALAAGETLPATEGQPPTTARISNQPRARFQRPMRRGGRPQRGGGRRPGRPNEQQRPNQQHSHPRHEQHKRPQLISEMLKAGEEIIVQIAKEPLGKKGARITSHVALPGRYLVYMPTVDHIGVSRRIGSAEDRSRLRRVVTEAKGTFPGGFIVRTAAAEASDDEIRTDVEFLGRTWDTIRGTSEQRRAPSLLHRDLNLVERILRDYLSEDYVAIWLDNEEEFAKVVEFVGRFQPKMVPRVKLYTKDAPIFEEFGIQQELDKALRPKVWLKSGGYIVINHTEALVAIDVNTGKYVGRGSTRLEDTIVKTNLEAVKEIVRQIRLRDLGGIIVCDLIDMEDRRNRDKVMAALDLALNQDRAPSKALSFNEFGLVCITRKRTKQALERVLCQPCPYCTGSGMVKSIPTICYEIQVEARKMSADMDVQSLTLRVNPEIAKALKTRESSLIDELEQTTKKSIIIQSDPTLHWEQYDIY
jgi:Rne/Rng family ribonuclease